VKLLLRLFTAASILPVGLEHVDEWLYNIITSHGPVDVGSDPVGGEIILHSAVHSSNVG